MAKSPAFQFYPNDWLASRKVAMMTPDQEGAYIRLLCYMWNDPDCSLPDDDNELASLSRLHEGWLKGGSSAIRKCFMQHPEKVGFLTHDRLLTELKKQAKWREKSAEGGKKSAESRINNVLKGGSRVVEGWCNTSSSFSSSSLNKNTLAPDGAFDRFWLAYPKRKSKGQALKAWNKLKPNEQLQDRIHIALERAKTSAEWRKDNGQFIPHPASWLNAMGWEDEQSTELNGSIFEGVT